MKLKSILGLLAVCITITFILAPSSFGTGPEVEIVCPPNEGISDGALHTDEPLKKDPFTNIISRIQDPVRRAIAKMACENRDLCPDNPQKTDPGVCGCEELDIDVDRDGFMDCEDLCPVDPDKSEPGACGCGYLDTDSDGDGTADCIDLCPDDPDKTEPGVCNCGTADEDSDGDGALNCEERCPNDPNKTEPGVCGCGYPDTDSDNDGIPDCIDPYF